MKRSTLAWLLLLLVLGAAGMLMLVARYSRTSWKVVYVATQDIPFGTVLHDPGSLFKAIGYSDGRRLLNTVEGLAQLKGRVLVRPLSADQPIKNTDLSWSQCRLEAGMSAASFKPNRNHGFRAVPSTRMDLFSIRNDSEAYVSKLLIADIPVIHDDGHTLFVALSEADTRLLEEARRSGKVFPGLRRPGNEVVGKGCRSPFDDPE